MSRVWNGSSPVSGSGLVILILPPSGRPVWNIMELQLPFSERSRLQFLAVSGWMTAVVIAITMAGIISWLIQNGNESTALTDDAIVLIDQKIESLKEMRTDLDACEEDLDKFRKSGQKSHIYRMDCGKKLADCQRKLSRSKAKSSKNQEGVRKNRKIQK